METQNFFLDYVGFYCSFDAGSSSYCKATEGSHLSDRCYGANYNGEYDPYDEEN